MFGRFLPTVLAVTETVSRRADELCGRIGEDIADEDDFTSRLADRIEWAVDGLHLDGIQWRVRARKLESKRRASEEARVGADLGVVIRMSGKGFDVRKGYLIQSKLVRDISLDRANRSPFRTNDRVIDQCKKMLRVTPESYVWLYTPSGVSVLRAGTVLDVDPQLVHRAARQSLHDFFLAGFLSWSGDRAFVDVSKGGLERMSEEYGLRQTLALHAREVDTEEHLEA